MYKLLYGLKMRNCVSFGKSTLVGENKKKIFWIMKMCFCDGKQSGNIKSVMDNIRITSFRQNAIVLIKYERKIVISLQSIYEMCRNYHSLSETPGISTMISCNHAAGQQLEDFSFNRLCFWVFWCCWRAYQYETMGHSMFTVHTVRCYCYIAWQWHLLNVYLNV